MRGSKPTEQAMSSPFDDDAALDLEPTTEAPAPGRKPRVRGKTISIKRLAKRELEAGRIENPDTGIAKPKTRGECAPLLKACPNCGVVAPMRVSFGHDETDRSYRNENRISCGDSTLGKRSERFGHDSDVGMPVRLRKDNSGEGSVSAGRDYSELRMQSNQTRDVRNRGVQLLEQHDGAVQKHEVEKVRGEGHQGLRAVVDIRELLRGHGTTANGESLPRQNQQRGELRAEQLSVGNLDTASEEQIKLSCAHCGQRVVYHRGVGGADWNWKNYDPRKDKEGVVSGKGHIDSNIVLGKCRPCVHVGCKHNLYLDVSPRSGAIKLNFPHLEPWEMQESCALDVADRGGSTLEEVGLFTALTRERIRQLETKGLAKIKALSEMAALMDYVE